MRIEATPDRPKAKKVTKKAAVEEATTSDSNISPGYADLDDFIDDMSEFERLPVKRGTETSRHFSTTTSIEPSDEPDEFEKVTMEDCFTKLVRLRNDVL